MKRLKLALYQYSMGIITGGAVAEELRLLKMLDEIDERAVREGGFGVWGGLMQLEILKPFEPENEAGTRDLFVVNLSGLGYNIVKSQAEFPDYILRDRLGQLVKCEVEFLSSNFIAHGHRFAECDLLVCWKNDIDLPLETLELSTGKLLPKSRAQVKNVPYEQVTRQKEIPSYIQALAEIGHEQLTQALLAYDKAFTNFAIERDKALRELLRQFVFELYKELKPLLGPKGLAAIITGLKSGQYSSIFDILAEAHELQCRLFVKELLQNRAQSKLEQVELEPRVQVDQTAQNGSVIQ